MGGGKVEMSTCDFPDCELEGDFTDFHAQESEEARAAREYAYQHMRVGHIESDLRDAYLAGVEWERKRVKVKEPSK